MLRFLRKQRREQRLERDRFEMQLFLKFFVRTGRTKRGKPVYRFDWPSYRLAAWLYGQQRNTPH